MKKNLSLYFHTVRYLKGKQIIHQLWHRVRKRIRNNVYPTAGIVAGAPLTLTPFIHKPTSLLPGSAFCFLNITDTFRGWTDKSRPKLWRYNLHYMDYLLQETISFEEKKAWIDSFIRSLPANEEGLEAYPTALRGVNWIKFISINRYLITDAEKSRWDESLYRQYLSLLDNLEYHLLGNHLLEDAFSLLWGGLYFRDDRFYQQSVELLIEELNEQILPDGAHYELSPMYHAILLDRLLDCINALVHNSRFHGQQYLTDFLKEKARLMLSWLAAVIYRDGTIPLLNDAAYGIAPDAQRLFIYADLLGLRWQPKALKESGYRKFVTNRLEMIIDVGHIGPDYIPGHAHADTFSYELRIDGLPFIVDSGISTYEKNARRQYERETQAHNTVNIDGLSSSEVWGGFRVARRAAVTYLKEDPNTLCARHNGFSRLGIEHRRIFNLSRNEILISDSLLPATGRKGVNTILLHPAVNLLSVSPDRILTDRAALSFSGADKLWVEDCEVAFEYNRLLPTRKICIAFTDHVQYAIRIPAEVITAGQ